MRLPLALGIAAAGLAFSAFAEPATTEIHRIIMHHGADMPDPDTNHDGWLSRTEASAMADRVFAELDSNHDGKLDATDHAAHHQMMMHEGDDADIGHGAHVQREVRIIHRDDAHSSADNVAPPEPPMPPEPPHPPMFMMLIANSEEADTNHDGALSLEEFRAQHLRFFDASDVNGDGKIRFHMPEPPAPPAPPQPPEPPRRP